MNWTGKLPNICRYGKSGLEKKLLLYYWCKANGYGFELRYSDSTLFNPDHLPPMEHPPEFIPMPEISQRVFLFKSLRDKRKAKEFLNDFKVARKSRSRRKRHHRRRG